MAHSTNKKWLNSGNIARYLELFAQELWDKFKGKVTASITIYGGSAIILKHPELRRGTVDIDSYIDVYPQNISLDNFIKEFAKKYKIAHDWLNEDVCKSDSFTMRLQKRTFVYANLHNCVEVRIINDLDQLCMKVMSGRDKDKQDIIRLAKKLKSDNECSFIDFIHTLKIIYGVKSVPQRSLNIVRKILS